MGPRVLLSLILLSGLACVRGTRPDPDSPPAFERIHPLSLEDALEEARRLLHERGFPAEPGEDPSGFFTTRQAPASGRGGQSRYQAVGVRVGPGMSVVRLFRLQWKAFGEAGYAVEQSTRDVELEQVLAARLASRPATSPASTTALPAPLPGPSGLEPEPSQPPLARDEEFYLERWAKPPASADGLCARRVQGLGALLRPGATLLIGDQLGSREVPAVLGDMACEAAEAGLTVTVALSIPREEQPRLDTFLASAGTPRDQDALLRGNFWPRPFQDGRSSRALFELIDRMRELRVAGLRVSVLAHDTEGASSNVSEQRMAEVLTQHRASHPEALLLVLVGNVHARTVPGAPWDAQFVPLGWHLLRADASMRAFDLSYAPGKRWGCTLSEGTLPHCGVLPARPGPRVAALPGLRPSIRLLPQPTEEGYHGLLYVGELTASGPATEPPLPETMSRPREGFVPRPPPPNPRTEPTPRPPPPQRPPRH